MPIVYKTVPGFPGYEVGSDGSVWTRWRLRRRWDGRRGTESYISETRKKLNSKLHDPDNTQGYFTVSLWKDRKGHDFLVHRLVLMVFSGECPEGMECCHKDGSRQNNLPSNLYWGTRWQNMQDQIRHGVSTKGERNPRSKLTETDVMEVYRLRSLGWSQQRIGDLLGVSQGCISLICNRINWGHLVITSQ